MQLGRTRGIVLRGALAGQRDSLAGDQQLTPLDERLQAYAAFVALAARAYADRVRGRFLVAEDQDERVLTVAKSRIFAFITSLRSSSSTRNPAPSSFSFTSRA